MNNPDQERSFYSFLLPNGRKCTCTNHQDVFSEYGCMEAVNLEFDANKEDFLFFAKKEMPVNYENDYFHTNVFKPSCEVLPFGDPNNISEIISNPTDKDLCSTYSDKGGMVLDVERQMVNLLADHPDAYHGTFLKMFAKYFPHGRKAGSGYMPTKDAMADLSKLPKKFALTRRLPNFHPSFLDIPHDLLNELVLEEQILQREKSVFNQSYSGGCLTHHTVMESDHYHCGLLVYPQGKAMDELSLQLFSTEPVQPFDSNPLNLNLNVGSSFRMKLNGTILQTCVTQSPLQEKSCIFSARSHYNALMACMDKSQISIPDSSESSGPTFASKSFVSELGALQSPTLISNLSINPYIHGESVVALYDGSVHLWRAGLGSKVHVEKNSSGLQRVMFTSERTPVENTWIQTAFAAHPRQLYVAKRNEVAMIDMRTKSVSPSRVLIVPPKTTLAGEKIMTILSGSLFSNPSSMDRENHCVVATQAHLMLMDRRFCRNPLLQWSISMKKPCQHLANVSFQDQNDNVSLLVAANQLPQEVHCFQYKTTTTTAGLQGASRTPPSSQTLPRSIGSFRSLRRAASSFSLPGRTYIADRLSMPTIGITAFGFKRKAVVFQLSECGDLIYQPMHTACKIAEETDVFNVTSGLRESFVSRENVAAKKAQEDWVAKISAQEFERSEDDGCLIAQRPLNFTRCSAPVMKRRFGKNFRVRTSAKCPLCQDECILRTRHKFQPSKYESSSDSDDSDIENFRRLQTENAGKCPRCDVCLEYGSSLLHCHRSGVPITSGSVQGRPVMFDETVTEREVKPLQLIDTTNASGLGHVLVSTWEGSYEDVWIEMDEQKQALQREEQRRKSMSAFDLHSPRASPDSVDATDEVSNPPVENKEKKSLEFGRSDVSEYVSDARPDSDELEKMNKLSLVSPFSSPARDISAQPGIKTDSLALLPQKSAKHSSEAGCSKFNFFQPSPRRFSPAKNSPATGAPFQFRNRDRSDALSLFKTASPSKVKDSYSPKDTLRRKTPKKRKIMMGF